MFKNALAIFASNSKYVHDNSAVLANSKAPRKISTRSLLQGVSILALLGVAIAMPQAVLAADGGQSFGTGLGGAAGSLGGTDGAAGMAQGQNGLGGGGGAVDLTTGQGAAGGRSSSNLGATQAASGGSGASNLSTANSTITGGTGVGGNTSVGTPTTGSGGGGGGVGVTTGLALTVEATGRIIGGAGGAGGSNAGGGGGAVGVFSTGNITIDTGGSVTGGAGGRGTAYSGGGGGAAALLLTGGGVVTNNGVLLGGSGGADGALPPVGGAGGSGGEAILLTVGGTVINQQGGTITGGAAGVNGTGLAAKGIAASVGGAAIKGADVTIVNAGTIAGSGTASAISFTGGINSLTLWSTSTIHGNVVAFGAGDTLALGGATTGSFAVSTIGTQYEGFGIYEKTGSSVWTLTGMTTAVTPWTLNTGVLSVSSDGSLGATPGGLTFAGGTLETTADGFSSVRLVTLDTAGTVQIDTGSSKFSGVIADGAAAGSLTKTGTGTLILTGVDTYTGGTTISAGMLQLGDGGTSGSIVGDVIDNGAIAFDRSDDMAFGGTISGTGAVSQLGAGAATLTGVNSYTGGTTISRGTLIGSAASFGTGAILNNAALVIDQPVDAEFTGAINGTGTLLKQGTGRLNLTGGGGLSGPTTVAAGLLSVNSSLANSAVTVQSGATLGGSGTVGATIIQSGATIAPGNSIGTLHVNGAFVQAAGSLYQVEVDPTSSASDLILVNGAASIANGASLNVAKNPPGDYRVGAQYTVLTASDGVVGNYAMTSGTAISQYLAVEESQDANNIYLRVIQTGDPATAAQTSNQIATATGTDSLPANNGVETTVLNTTDPGATRSAFDQLSGEALASAKSALVSGSLLVRDITFDRLRDVFCAAGDQKNEITRLACPSRSDRPTVWTQGFGSWGHVGGNGNAAALSESVGGFLVGVDMPIYDWRVGYFGGFSRTDFSVKARSSSGNSNNYHLGMYGGTQWGDLGVRLGASYSWNNLATGRSVTVGDLSNDLRANYNAGTTQIFGELGQRFVLDRFVLEPFANLAYVNLRTGGFSETGGDAALTARADTMEDTFTTLGMRPSTIISWGSFNATARGMASWRHAFGDVTPSSVVSFSGSDAFTITGAPIARDAAVAEAGLDFTVHDNVTAGITYGGQFSSRETDHSIRGTVAITF